MTDRNGMKKIIAIIAAALLLAGCGEFNESLTHKSVFEITLKDGTVVQCVQVTAGDSSHVAVDCDFDTTP